MIVKDEAEHLPKCLGAVQDCVDEIIVVDTGSQDETIAIAQQWGAQVRSMEWTQDFAAARNQSLALATGDWILVLDADETLTEAGRHLLRQIRSGQPLGEQPLDTVLGVTLLRHEVGADQTPYSEVLRLFRKHPDIRFERPYHETVDDSLERILQAESQWRVVSWPEVVLAHTGYAADAIAQRQKFTRARTVMEAYLDQHPDDAYICNKLGALYVATEDWERGRSLLEKALAHGQADPATTYELHYHLGLAYRAMGLTGLAIDHYHKALAQPLAAVLKLGAYINLGSLWQAQQQYAAAIEQFSQAVKAAPDFALAHFNLGTARRAQGDLEGAITAYRRAIALDPTYAAAYQNLGVALFKQNQLVESVAAFKQAIALYRQTHPAVANRLLEGLQSLGIGPEQLQ
jgi:tetratricopeptide (TPR) repeat protein